jgi:hypothetical protein
MVPVRRLLPRALILCGALAGAPAQAGDVTAFVTFPSPSDVWARGYGAALTSTWFHVVALEAEAARMPIEGAEGTMTSFSGSALLAPPVGPLVPYGGVGIGLYRQSLGTSADTGLLRCFILGAKLKLGLLVVRGDYRRLTLGDDALLPMDKRFSIGAGISF